MKQLASLFGLIYFMRQLALLSNLEKSSLCLIITFQV